MSLKSSFTCLAAQINRYIVGCKSLIAPPRRRQGIRINRYIVGFKRAFKSKAFYMH